MPGSKRLRDFMSKKPLQDHLKNWEILKLIMDSKVWKAGEEPLVAGYIISLFNFPENSCFLFE